MLPAVGKSTARGYKESKEGGMKRERSLSATACAFSLITAGWLSCFVLVAHTAQRAEPPLGSGALPLRQRVEDPAAFGNVRRVFLEVRLAEAEPVRGLTFEAALKGSPKKVYLHYAVLIANGDVQSARLVDSGGRYDVAITLSPDGAARMTSATARHVGRPLAIILDGEVAAVLTIRKALGAEVLFSGDFTREEAARIVSGLQRW
jgi:hypothetical protein